MASPHNLEPAIDAASPAEAHLIASMLHEQGIEAFVFDIAARTLLWDAPSLINPYMVHVQRQDIERAKSFIRTNRDDSVDLDWDEIDVGEMNDDGCLSVSIAKDEVDSFFFPLKYKLHHWILVGLTIVIFLIILDNALSS
ncbi:hypothetical protein JYS44_00655 [Phycisphaeraceae bacterium AH-315-B13]|nr:hypothetical protein [Phycisphaeraceae bacterium AH-315-B13]